MLVIRQAQMEALGAVTRRDFESRLARHFLRVYPRECAEAGGEGQIARFVARALNRAAARRYDGRKEIGLFAALLFILGEAFDSDPQIPWAARQLDNEKFPLATRPEIVFDSTIEYLGETAGEKCENVVRAMLRLRNYDLVSAPDFSSESWADGMCEVFERHYPEKFDYQGEAANRALLALARQSAERRGFHSNPGAGLFAILMFMLGSGFESDLLYPWAGAALAAAGEEEERTRILHRAALAHIENSLKPD
jgi:hypothetical protein